MAELTRGTGVWLAVIGTACGTAGWMLGHAQGERSAAQRVVLAAPAHPAPKPSAHSEPGPLIAVASDGRVTLHVDQQPLQWVLEEIERQAGDRPGGPRASAPAVPAARASTAVAAAPGRAAAPVMAPAPAPSFGAAPAPGADPLGTLLRGSEPERYAGLQQALGGGGGMAPEGLQTLFETDGSPRVRLLAFEASLEAHAGDAAALRAALEAARRLPDAVLVEDATRRLDELDRTPSPDTVPQVAPGR